MKDTRIDRLKELIEDVEIDRNYLPHFGLIPDWFKVYEEIKEIVYDDYEKKRKGFDSPIPTEDSKS